MTNTPSKAEIEALVKRHGATSYRNRADTQHPAYGFTEDGLNGLIDEVLAKWGTPQPAPAPLSERNAFEAAWEKLHGKRPVLWSRVFAEHKMETPSHSEGKYFARDGQAAWKLWQARAAIAAQGGK